MGLRTTRGRSTRRLAPPPEWGPYRDRHHGPIVTDGMTLAQLRQIVSDGGYDTVKVVTGWGLEGSGGWAEPGNIEAVCALAPVLIVRTNRGDGADRQEGPDWALLDADAIEAEIAPWHAARQDILIELGNEPNGTSGWRRSDDPDFIPRWRDSLGESIARCRVRFPEAQLISPGLANGRSPGRGASVDPARDRADLQRWFDTAGDVLRACDMIGVHGYAFHSFFDGDFDRNAPANDGRGSIVQRLGASFGTQPWFLTEYGINSALPAAEKGFRYAGFVHFGQSNPDLPVNCRGAVYYHFKVGGGEDPYIIFPDGDIAYGQVTRQS